VRAERRKPRTVGMAEGFTKLGPSDYGLDSQLAQLEKYRNRESNHWRHRIALAFELVDEYALPRLGKRDRRDVVVVDIGCSIGTFALEFARAGYRAMGLDFDLSAIEIARELAREENLDVDWVCADAVEWQASVARIDIAVVFDLFEHLKDDEIGALLASLKRSLSANASVVFHTYPSEFTHIFRGGLRRSFPLLPFRWLSAGAFARLTRAYAALIDAALLLFTGQNHSERIEHMTHTNPLTVRRIRGILERAGYSLLCVESGDLYERDRVSRRRFSSQPIAHRNIFGVAVKR
jgi:2-polyprenyl-3-methyl-5-hydroxy-6-metoxy-1,4-benzoquinol methylase